jgi:predicted SprT family Zn-dependent metalloprotease
MNRPSSGNSIIPSEQDHDDYYAHRCTCGVAFSKQEPMFDTSEGYLCEACADKHDEDGKETAFQQSTSELFKP